MMSIHVTPAQAGSQFLGFASRVTRAMAFAGVTESVASRKAKT